MSYATLKRILRPFVTGLAVVVAACGTDSPTENQFSKVEKHTKPAHLTSWASGSTITVVDDADARQFTFDFAANEIRISDGTVVDLSPEQAVVMAAAFYGTLVTDSVETDLGACFSEAGCVEASLRANLFSGDVSEIVARRSEVSGKGQGTVAATSTDVCTDAVNAALPAKVEYRQQRTSYLKDALEVAGSEIINGVTHYYFVPGGGAALILLNKAADYLNARTNVAVLGFMWNSYGCASRTIVAGPVSRPGAGGSGEGMTKVCANEAWEISFSGSGGPWYPITVLVCEYRQNT